MRRAKKVLATLLVVCMLCNIYGSNVLAAGNGATETVNAADSIENALKIQETEQTEPVEGGAADSDTDDKTDEVENPDSDSKEESDKNDEADSEDESDNAGDTDTTDHEGSQDGEGSGETDVEDSDDESDETEEDSTEDELTDPEEDEIIEDEEAELLLMDNSTLYTVMSGEVSRIEWLSALTDTFGMSVKEDNYPDNYYSDINSSSLYYYKIMLATEFGLIDVEAGDALHPDDPATREFAAHTLNLCLGYLPESDNYTFSDSVGITYADDIQIAIDREWLELKDGKFLPDEPITSAEMDAMLAEAAEILKGEVIDSNHNNSYKFASDVIVLPENTEIVLTGENEFTIYNCTTTLQKGDKFGIVSEGMPAVYKISDITVSEEKSIITFEYAEMSEAFELLDVEGILNGDLAATQAYSNDIELNYIVGGTEEEEWEDGIKYDTLEEVGNREISAVEAVVAYDISEEVRKQFDLEKGVKATISCKIADVNPKYSASLAKKEAYFNVDAKVTFSCSVSLDVLEAMGKASKIQLVYVPIYAVGYFKVELDLSAKGAVTVSYVEKISMGIQYSAKEGFRVTRNFTKDSFTINVHAEVSAGIIATVGINVCNILKGSVYGKVGAKGVLDSMKYIDDKSPHQCTHISAWLYASVGCEVSLDLIVTKIPYEKKFDIYTEKNSPVRVQFHFEDGKAVAKCTRDGGIGENGEEGGSARWKYYTPADSRYGYNGASKGTGSNGETYTIFEYSLDKENNATITKYNGNVSALSIPETLDGYKVVGIGSAVFQNNTMLRVVVIPDSVTEIGMRAFNKCTNLSQVTLSRNLKNLHQNAFGECDSLTAIEIPKSLESATYRPFEGCENLRDISFEAGTTHVVSYLFDSCPGIEKIIIPNTVTIIETQAFRKCENLREVSLPNSVTEIGNSAFTSCGKLTQITIPDSVRKIEGNAFSGCTSLSQVVLSKNLVSMGINAFGNCTALTTIEIPKSLESAAYRPFEGCINLKNISFEAGTIRIADYLFDSCPGIEEIIIPNTVTVIETQAFRKCENLENVSIPNSVTEIGSSAFASCNKLTQITIPDSVKKINNNVFLGCTDLSQVTLSKRLVSMGINAFGNCTALTTIEIPKSLESASARPFEGCINLKDVSFEEGTTRIADYLFDTCPGIEKIIIPDTVTVIETQAFRKCENLVEVSIPNSVTEIGSSAFASCDKLTQITISNGVTTIGISAFENCTNLVSVTLSKNLKEIKSNAFKNTGISGIIIPEGVTSIAGYAFQDCSSLTEVTLPSSLKSLGAYTFYNCDFLTKVEVPDSVTSLGTYIFADCELLSDVTLGTGITTIPNNAFYRCPSLQSIVLPYRVTTINKNAFMECTSLTEITIPRATTKIEDSVFSYPFNLIIYGVSKTYAEAYAEKIGATFVSREVNATEVKLNTTDLKLANGTKATLILSVAPSDFTDEVTWRSTDTSIVTVADTGEVTAKKIGTATIKVTVGDVSASCRVTVTQPVTSISLNKTSLSLEAWDSETLKATVSPSTAENKEVAWSTSDASVATVDNNGLVTAVSKGTATITATAQDGTGKYKNCTVTVVSNGYICSTVGELESEHNYPANCSDFWQYTKEGAESLYMTFDTRTNIEEDFDFIYIYDGKKKQIGKYTGTSLAGQTVEVPGDTVRIKLVSDDAGSAWGFKVTYLMGTGDVENDQYLVTFDSQGGTAVSSVQVAKDTAVTKPADPTRQGYEFLGWYLNGELYDFTQPVTRNTVLIAKWKVIRIDVDPAEGEVILEEDMPVGGVVPAELWIAGVTDQTYTGKAIKPEVRVYDGAHRLTEKTDYTISYKNNTKANDATDEAKAPTISVKGKGNYTGTATATFKINQVDLNGEAIEVSDIVLAYNEKVQQKAPTVTFNGKKLAPKNNYTISYPDEGSSGAYQDVGTYQVQLTGIGNYTGTKTVNLKITKDTLIEKAKSVKIKDKSYNNGDPIELTENELILYMKNKNEPLTKGVDYTVEYENNCEIGTATAVIKGIEGNSETGGGYAGTKRVTFRIVGTPINKVTVTGIADKTYSGQEQSQNITVTTLEGKVLAYGTDYEVTYSNNVNVGKASITIQGKGAYSGSIKKTFKITAYDMGKDEEDLITGMIADTGTALQTALQEAFEVNYVKGGCKPEVVLLFDSVELTKGTNYTLSYKNNMNIADTSARKVPTVTVKGKGNFKGSFDIKFSIAKRNLADVERPITMTVADVAYASGAGKYISKPVLTDVDGKTLKSGTDYTVSYTKGDGITKLNSKSTMPQGSYVCVTVSGIKKYTGSMMTTYRITSANFTKATIKIDPQFYTGRAIYLTGENITVKLAGENLTYGEDYEILEDSYTNNIKKGTASVKIRGIGAYGGIKTVRFKIQAKKMESFADIVRTLLFGTE